MRIKFALLYVFMAASVFCQAQNSMVGDGFGGRLWYKPYNFSAGSYSAFSVCGSERQLYGWGSNFYGEIGKSAFDKGSKSPVQVAGISGVKYYTCGYYMGAILDDNSGWFWGGFKALPPQKVLANVKFADAGSRLCSFVKYDGTVWSVGDNTYGSFGNDSVSSDISEKAVQMIGITNAVRCAAGQGNTIVLLADGTVMSTGTNAYGGLGCGDATVSIATVPVRVKGLENIVDIKAIASAYVALDKSGDVWQWGNSFSTIEGKRKSIYTPEKITTIRNIVALSGCDDGNHFLFLDVDKNCYAFLYNGFGQCGADTIRSVDYPQLVERNVSDILAGETFSYIIKDSMLYCAGSSAPESESVWLDLTDEKRVKFTRLDPVPGFALCKPYIVAFDNERVQSLKDTIICLGDTLNLPQALNLGSIGVNPPIAYNLDSVNRRIQFYPVQTTRYTLTNKNCNCDSVSFTVSVPPGPKSDFNILPSIANPENAIFQCMNQSIGADRYQWYYAGQLVSGDKDITHYFPDPGQYCFTLVASDNCGNKDSSTRCCTVVSKWRVVFPNAFTPNGDGRNDRFKPLLSLKAKSYSFFVYNRYGQQIFHTNDVNEGWDGRFRNRDEDVGVYYYFLKVMFDDPYGAKEELFKGDVSLIR